MLEDIASQLGPDRVAPSEDWLSTQLALNNCRVLINEKMHSRIEVNRRAQKHEIVKKNADGHFLNACLKRVRKFSILHKNNTTCVASDDKCLIKVGAPGFLLALLSKIRRAFIPRGI